MIKTDEIIVSYIVLYVVDFFTFFLVTVIALLLQICGIIIWPVMNMTWKDDSQLPPSEITTYWVLENSWGLPLGLFLTSFGYWESFVDENQFSNRNFLWRVKINMIEEGARYTTYLFISIWKMALFLCLFLLLSTTVVRPTALTYRFSKENIAVIQGLIISYSLGNHL